MGPLIKKSEEEVADRTELPAELSGRPWVTYSIIAICAAMCAYYNLSEESPLYQRFESFAVPSNIAIWSGSYWGLLTSALMHFGIWHIVFNMWWLKDFGSLLEPTLGRSKYILFIISAAVISSGAQLAASGQTGVGFSGVIYAMFGYMLAARTSEPIYGRILTKQITGWLLGWLVLCLILTYTNIWNIGNTAHFSGFLFGYCVANIFKVHSRMALSRIVLAAMVLLTVSSVLYVPWSDSWKYRRTGVDIIALRDAASAGDPQAEYGYSRFLWWNGTKHDALAWLKRSADQDHVPALNTLAWFLATNRDDTIRDGRQAVTLAEKACEKDDWKDAAYVDTLAAAYAEVEQWYDAIRTQKMAISKLEEKDSDLREEFNSRLTRYMNHEKTRE
jgi:GlpG protein